MNLKCFYASHAILDFSQHQKFKQFWVIWQEKADQHIYGDAISFRAEAIPPFSKCITFPAWMIYYPFYLRTANIISGFGQIDVLVRDFKL